MPKRKVLIQKRSFGNKNTYSYVTFSSDVDDVILDLQDDIYLIKNEINELKPFVNRYSQLKRELNDYSTVLELLTKNTNKEV